MEAGSRLAVVRVLAVDAEVHRRGGGERGLRDGERGAKKAGGWRRHGSPGRMGGGQKSGGVVGCG